MTSPFPSATSFPARGEAPVIRRDGGGGGGGGGGEGCRSLSSGQVVSRNLEPHSQHFIFFLTYERAHHARTFLPGRPFQTSVM